MKVIRILFAFLLLYAFSVQAQSLKKMNNTAFIRGERLTFRAYYDSFVTGKVTAGIATLDVKFENKKINGRPTFHIIGEGRSKGAFNFFFKVNDKFESYIDEEFLVPWQFTRKTREGDFKKDDEVNFDQMKGVAKSSTATKKIPVGTHDILSAFYYARNLDFSRVKPGDKFPVHFFLDDSTYVSAFEFLGKEEIEVEMGRFRCLKFKPMLATGNVFKEPYAMELWVTDDKNHLPILAKSEVIVGSVKLELTEYKGLANPVSSYLGSTE
ncbi:MAG: DUF3108 domain-containing protein [Syntrophothermus sp.]